MKRIAALTLAYFFLALAIIGIFLPGLPTVPFLLLTAWLAAKSSEHLHTWLYEHPKFGQLLIDWEEQKAISLKSKVIAVVMLAVSWMVMFFQLNHDWFLVGMTVLFICIAGYLISRPQPHS